MTKLYLHKISDTEYAILGNIELTKTIYEQIEYEGEIFTRQYPEKYICDLDEEFKKGKLSKFSTNFLEKFGEQEITLHYMDLMYGNTLDRYYRYQMSSNPYVYFLQFLEQENLLPQKFRGVGFGKSDYWESKQKPLFKYIIYSYGYNNFALLDIGYHDIVKYNIPNHKILTNQGYLFRQKWLLENYDHIKDKIIWLDKYLEKTYILHLNKI